MSSFSIKATAKAVPEKIVTNDDLAEIMDTSDEWISRRTGIKERRVAISETTTSLCAEVASKLLDKANVDASQIDFIIVGTMSSDYQTPSTAAAVQGIIGANKAIAFDINAACSGFVYGSYTMQSLLNGKPNSLGIVIGGEQLSKLINWHDRTTAVLFGDGAGGMLVSNQGSGEVLASNLKTYGDQGKALLAGHMIGDEHFGKVADRTDQYFHMDGREVFNFATKNVPNSIKEALSEANLDANDVKYFILHQANARIVRNVARKMKVDDQKFPINIDRYGNTAAASEPILLSEMMENGLIAKGDIIVLSGFGGGLTTGTMILRY
ncbi:beta-ketoacyl-ACP synthase III [Apilactobacillus timberlakei]|uniref:Beta-ketoacyl-[acyl-carrier-protein] synthase III n=1 Tax=Apilactobacillus timberlakei TaxID=2008380 RepID=A0ABY2YVV7_9LACO|nr:beta-ketoacyl-ACP synthase III [Apilactobacillus timberlakei]TPR14781.1 ketoacyl-ACP synthase III [Apilactobacillus timberlakei]TPR15748.1 ketoacyl-ACP synthase III [Apilactobacillus timberlakei]TPR16109.1 ketoacyl-ACP synthase III [Apilactobacillus timberlakei]